MIDPPLDVWSTSVRSAFNWHRSSPFSRASGAKDGPWEASLCLVTIQNYQLSIEKNKRLH